MRVRIPSQLHSYTHGCAELDGTGQTIAELLEALNSAYPGLRFRIIDEQDRIRPHIRFFVNRELIRTIAYPIGPDDEVHIICAISGG
jgi:sulfur-carrier protein